MSRQEADQQAERVRGVIGEAQVMGQMRLGAPRSASYFIYVPSSTGHYAELHSPQEVDAYLERVARAEGGA